jgi:hypothetical protein
MTLYGLGNGDKKKVCTCSAEPQYFSNIFDPSLVESVMQGYRYEESTGF